VLAKLAFLCYYVFMETAGYTDSSPSQEVRPETLRALRTTMNRWFEVVPPRRSKALPQGSVVEATYEEGKIRQDWDSLTPNSIVSGQICDAKQDVEFVVMTPLEGQTLSVTTMNGKEVTPCGSVRKLSTDPADPTGEDSLSRIYVPTLEGVVFEVDEGVYMSDEYCDGKVTIRELWDHEVAALTADLSTAYDTQVR